MTDDNIVLFFSSVRMHPPLDSRDYDMQSHSSVALFARVPIRYAVCLSPLTLSLTHLIQCMDNEGRECESVKRLLPTLEPTTRVCKRDGGTGATIAQKQGIELHANSPSIQDIRVSLPALFVSLTSKTRRQTTTRSPFTRHTSCPQVIRFDEGILLSSRCMS